MSRPHNQGLQPRHTSHSSISGDRYTALQRRLEDLERVHAEGKRSHQAETDRLKTELARYQKQHADQTEVVERQKKQLGLLESRVQELKKSGTTDTSQVRELRLRIRTLELERSKLQLDASQVESLKKSLQRLEDQRKRDIAERDTAVADLEKRLALEQQSREALSKDHEDLKSQVERDSRNANNSLNAQIREAREETCRLKDRLVETEERAEAREEELLSQLEQHRLLLNQVASEFGALASHTVSRIKFERLQTESRQAQVRNITLERRLANSEAQVVELAQLIRYNDQENQLLRDQLDDATRELSMYHDAELEKEEDSVPPPVAADNADELGVIQQSMAEDKLRVAVLNSRTYKLLSIFYQRHTEDLAIFSSLQTRTLRNAELLEEQHDSQLSETLASHEAMARRLEIIQTEYSKLQEKVACTIREKEQVEGTVHAYESRAAELDDALAGIESKHRKALNSEKAHIQRLNQTVQKQQMAEQGLRDEIERLTGELASLEHYQSAFEQLKRRVDSLVARKKVAEDEAAELCQFNAQILGHHNPAQRIMYVDRIRRELADAKQRLAELQINQDNAVSQNAALMEELAVYKSVMVPQASKPRTHITRVTRAPLANLATSMVNKAAEAPLTRSTRGSQSKDRPLNPQTDFTLDELEGY